MSFKRISFLLIVVGISFFTESYASATCEVTPIYEQNVYVGCSVPNQNLPLPASELTEDDCKDYCLRVEFATGDTTIRNSKLDSTAATSIDSIADEKVAEVATTD